jgi:hypothetical protein
MKNRLSDEEFFKEIFDRITPEEHAEFEREIEESIAHSKWMEENGIAFCTDTSPNLKILKEYGFNPIEITSFYLEESFIFKTKKEANLAYKKLEKELGLVIGWWYSKKDFYKELYEASQKGGLYEKGHPKIYKL